MKNLNWLLVTVVLLVQAVLIVEAHAEAAPSTTAKLSQADTLLKQCTVVFDKAKTIQTTITSTLKQGTEGFVAILKVKIKNQNDGQIARESSVFTHTIQTGKETIHTERLITDDGKNHFMYSPPQNQYAKSPHEKKRLSDGIRSFLPSARDVRLFVSTAKEKGRDVFLLQNARVENDKIRILLDKVNGQFLSFQIISSQGEIKLSLADTILDAPLADDLFEWSPPENARKVTPDELVSTSP